MVMPPSTARHWPVMYDAAGRARNATAAATSWGSAMRPSGVRARIAASASGRLSTGSTSGVRVYHGATVLTRMPSRAHSSARVRVACARPALAAPYGTPVGSATWPATEPTWMTLASPAARRAGCRSRERKRGAVRLSASSRSMVASS